MSGVVSVSPGERHAHVMALVFMIIMVPTLFIFADVTNIIIIVVVVVIKSIRTLLRVRPVIRLSLHFNHASHRFVCLLDDLGLNRSTVKPSI